MRTLSRKLCIVLAILLLVIIIKDEYTYILLKNADFGMIKLIEKGNVDNLFIGSSAFRQGIDIFELDKNGKDNYILAYNGNEPWLEYYQIKKLFDSGVNIKNVYIDMYAYSLWADPKLSDDKILLEYNISEKGELYRNLKSENFKKNFSLFWGMFVSANNEMLLTWPVSNYLVNSIFHNGGSTIKPESISEESLNSINVHDIIGECNSVQKYYLERMIELLKESGTNICFIETPKYYLTSNYNGYINAMNDYEEILKQENVAYFRCPDEYDIYESDYFTDHVHLSYNGRTEYTRILSEYINSGIEH